MCIELEIASCYKFQFLPHKLDILTILLQFEGKSVRRNQRSKYAVVFLFQQKEFIPAPMPACLPLQNHGSLPLSNGLYLHTFNHRYNGKFMQSPDSFLFRHGPFR